MSFGLVGLERRRSCCSRLVVDARRRAGPSRCHSSLSSSKWFRGKSPVRRRLQSCSCRASVRGCTLFLWWRTYSCMRACWSCVCTCIYLAMHARIRVRARARVPSRRSALRLHAALRGRRCDGVLRRLFITASLLILASLRRRRHRVDAGLNGRRQSCRRPQRLHGGVVVGSMPGLNVKRQSCRRRTSVSSWRRSRRSMPGLNMKRRSCRRRASASPQWRSCRQSMPGLMVKCQPRHAAPRRPHSSSVIVIIGRS